MLHFHILLEFAFRLVLSTFVLSINASAQPFDYLIVDGGTSGLTLAIRLSEIPNITVAIIEAGDSVLNSQNVTGVNGFTLALGTSLDWQYESANQTHANGRTIEHHSGKALGGSSAINGMTYIRASKSQIDAWEELGNEGWNWDTLFPYYKKSESFSTPTSSQGQEGASYRPNYHGEHGPLNVGYPYDLENTSFHSAVAAAWEREGIPKSEDMNGGDVRGHSLWPSTIDREANVREDAGRAYYYPVQDRPNLKVFLNTTANRIIWAEGCGEEEIVAVGVELTFQNGTVGILRASREVTLAAGTLRSPAILELSGVGDPEIVQAHSIPLKFALPSVGANLQDQPNVAMVHTTNTTFHGALPLITYLSLNDIPSLSTLTLPSSSHTKPFSSSSTLNNVQTTLLSYPLSVPGIEIITESTIPVGQGASNTIFTAFWPTMPYSRGSVHIRSPDSLVYPVIDAGFFEEEWDLDVVVEVAKFVRGFWQDFAVREGWGVMEVSPGLEAVGGGADDEVWREWVRGTFSANSHPIGTCIMLPMEKRGVVDSKMKVYGTRNVRVVDASIWPLQVSGHLTSTIYAVAERMADIMKEELREKE